MKAGKPKKLSKLIEGNLDDLIRWTEKALTCAYCKTKFEKSDEPKECPNCGAKRDQ